MPRITKSGPVLSMATKLYLITSTVATGVGGGFFVPRCFPMALPSPSWLHCPQKRQSCSYGSPRGGAATLLPSPPLLPLCHGCPALAITTQFPRKGHEPSRGNFFIPEPSFHRQASRPSSPPSFRFLTTYQVAPINYITKM